MIVAIILVVLVGVLIGLGIIFVTLGGTEIFVNDFSATQEYEDTEEEDTEEQDTEDTEVVENTEADTEEATEEEITIEDYNETTCEDLVTDLKKQESTDVRDYDTLFDMAKVLVNAKIIDDEGEILSKMSDENKLLLDYRIIAETLYDDSTFGDELQLEDYSKCDLEDAEALFFDIYGCDEVPDEEEGFGIQVEGETLEFMMADGDAWETIYNASVREMDDYYLLTAPYFYGSNGQSSEELQGYIDVLFVKNKESRFGVTMLYAKTYESEIEIDSIEVSSQLDAMAGKTYTGDNLFDGDYTTAWVEGEDGDGAGETITIYLSNPTEVHGILLFNGYLASVDLYDKNGKVTAVFVDFGDGNNLEFDVPAYDLYFSTDDVAPEDYSIGRLYPQQSVVTDKIVITLESGSAGSKYEDICISELLVY